MSFACSFEDLLGTCAPLERSSPEGVDGFELLGSRGISSLELLCFRAREGVGEPSAAAAKVLAKHSVAENVLLLVSMGEGRAVLRWVSGGAGSGSAGRRFRHTREREICGICLLLLETKSERPRLLLLGEVFSSAWSFRHKDLLSQHYLCTSLPRRLERERWLAASEHGARVLAGLDDRAKQGWGKHQALVAIRYYSDGSLFSS